MPTVTITTDVDVDLDDVLDELSIEDLEAALAKRQTRSGAAGALVAPREFANDLREAFYRRDASHFEALLARLSPLEFQMPRGRSVAELPGMRAAARA